MSTLTSRMRLEDYANISLPSEYDIVGVMDDIIMAKFIDCDEKGEYVDREGILMSLDSQRSCWRVAEVIMCGPSVSESITPKCLVMLPNDRGIKAVNFGSKKEPVVFINEERIFCICKKK